MATFIQGTGQPVTQPSPDYPQKIESVGDKTKNLFNKQLFSTDTGTTLIYTQFVVPNGTYTMSSSDFPYINSITNVFFIAGNVSSGASSTDNGVAINKPITITVTDGYYTVVHRQRSSTNLNHPINYNWQIEEGLTATSYEPYGYKIPLIISNKQNVPYVELPNAYQQVEYLESSGTQRITTIPLTENYYRVVTKAQGTLNQNKSQIIFDFMDGNPCSWIGANSSNKWGCGTVSGAYTSISFLTEVNINAIFTKNGNNFTLNATINNETISRTQTQARSYTNFQVFGGTTDIYKSNVKIYFLKLYNQSNTLLLDLVPCYRKSDNIAGMYDLVNNVFYDDDTGTFTVGDDINALFTNIYLDEPLRKVGTYADYIDFKNQKVVKNIKKTILTGTENWYYSVSGTNYRAYTTDLINTIVKSNNIMSNKYGLATLLVYPEVNCIGVNSNGAILVGVDSSITSANDYKTFLANQYSLGTPVIIYNPIVTPTEESITLPTISTYSGQNYFSLGTSINASNTLVKYYKN